MNDSSAPCELATSSLITGYNRHNRKGEEPCDYCRERRNEHYRKKREEHYDRSSPLVCEHKTKRNPDGARGTYAGWQRHRTAGQQPCVECEDAYYEYKHKARANSTDRAENDRLRRTQLLIQWKRERNASKNRK